MSRAGVSSCLAQKNKNYKFWFRDVLAWTGICFIACRTWYAIQETTFREEKKRVH